MNYCLIYVTFPNTSEAENIGQELVAAKLAACVNIFPTITSIYRWQNTMQREQEVAMLIKTRADYYEKIEKKLTSTHSYDTCCVLKIPLTAGSEKFLRWIDNSLSS